ncbi:hypothetical protein MYX65_05910 [Acidobacteria bacterium AH-259-L09]|nr:hypothetical protein [Acidobacteria bacterium AH-259-L09]
MGGENETTATSAAITSTNPASLTESNLNGATVTVRLTNGTYNASLLAANFSLNGAPTGTTISSVSRDSLTQASLTLAFDGTDFETDATMSVTVLAAALATGTGPVTTGTVTAVVEATAIYYSVGTDTSALYSGNGSASSGVLTLSSSASNNIGVGDEVREGLNRYYITQRNSSTSFNIQNSAANGGTPGATNITFADTSITIYRAFNSLDDAVDALDGGVSASDSNHLNTTDLVTADYQLNIACYGDTSVD